MEIYLSGGGMERVSGGVKKNGGGAKKQRKDSTHGLAKAILPKVANGKVVCVREEVRDGVNLHGLLEVVHEACAVAPDLL
jgi:hypothetical protein